MIHLALSPLNFTLPNLKKDFKHLIVVFVSVFAVYLATLPPSVTMEDSGLFILSSYFNGVCHPPGYPLHSLIGQVFTWLPFEPAYCVNMMSAFFGAGTCVCLWWLLRLILPQAKGVVAAYMGALAFGLSHTFWTVAIVAEVYTLNAFLCFLYFVFLVSFNVSGKPKHLYAASFVFALGLCNHYPLLLLSAVSWVLMVLPRWRLFLKCLPVALICVLVGLFPYVYLYFHFPSEMIFSFSGSQEGWQDFWYYLSRKNYSNLEDVESANVHDKLQFAGFMCRQLMVQLTAVGALFSLAGFAVQWKRLPWPLALTLTGTFLGSTFILIALLGFDYDEAWQNVFQVYPVVAYGIWALWLGLGAHVFFEFVSKKIKGLSIHVMTAVVLVLALLGYQYGDHNRRHDTWATDFAKITLDALPPNAIYFTDSDWDVGPLAYVQLVDNYRPDVTLYNDKGIGFQNRLMDPIDYRHLDTEFKNATIKKQRDVLFQFISNPAINQGRPIYYTNENMHSPYAREVHGFYSHALNGVVQDGKVRVKLNKKTIDYFKKILDMPEPHDTWVRTHRRMIIAKMAAALTPLAFGRQGDPQERQKYFALLKRTRPYFLANIRIAHQLFEMKYDNIKHIEEIVNHAGKVMTGNEKLGNQSNYYTLQAFVAKSKGDLNGYQKYLEKAVAVFPNKKNPSVISLTNYYKALGKQDELNQLRLWYPRLFKRGRP